MLAGLSALILLSEAAPVATAPGRGVFACELGGKRLWLTAEGEDLTYHYGAPDREELTIVGRPGAGNLHYRLRDETIDGGRFIAASIRFTNRGYEYIVNYDIQSRPPFPRTAHILVLKGDNTLKVESCLAFSVERSAYDFSQVPSEMPKFYSEIH